MPISRSLKTLSTAILVSFIVQAFGAIPAWAGAPVLAEPENANVRITMHFDAEQLLATANTGLAHRASQRHATLADPVRIASISKLVVALGAMRLVEHGVVELDRDISLYLGWPVRHPRHPNRPITLRMLLSHQSGLRDDAGYFIALDAPLRDLIDDRVAWDADHPPGSYFRYANLNYPLVAAVMEAASGRRFDEIIAENIFEPLNIQACFNWSGCSADSAMSAITLYRPDGSIARDDWIGAPDQCATMTARDGRCDIALYRLGQNGSAFAPQGGLRISANGLMQIGQLLLNGGAGVITPASFAEMTRAQWRFDGHNGDDDHGYFTAFGLGVHRIERAGQIWLGHSGEAYGLRAGLWVNLEQHQGVLRIATGVAEDAPIGQCLDQCP